MKTPATVSEPFPVRSAYFQAAAPMESPVMRKNISSSSVPASPDAKSSRLLSEGLKQIEFHLIAPAAHSVKLAADFTDWERSALNLIKTAEGIWFTFVPLSPGQYAYRFIVDGQWRDDPHSHQHIPNPFGATNAVINVL